MTRGALLAGIAAALACACGGGRAPHPRWNVVLISVDTLRAGHLNCYGYSRRHVTPHIDGLARDGILFESHMANAPWTTPSHMSLLTSLLPGAHGVTTFPARMGELDEGGTAHRLPDARITLAEALQASGRRTAAFTGGRTVDPRFGFSQGFERYETSMQKLRPRNMQPLYDWIDASGDRPFFLFWHTFEVHAPYLETAFLDEVLPEATARNLRRGIARATRAATQGAWAPSVEEALLDRLDAYTLPVCEALYAGGVQSMDRWVGQLVHHLRDRGLYDRTLIALTSDHGEEMGERGLGRRANGRGMFNAHGHSLYDELLHVPLVIKLPYQEHAGTRVAALTGSIDVMPTVLDVLGLPLPDQMQGVSLRGLWERRAERPRLVLSESLSVPYEKKGVRSGQYKYIVSIASHEVERHGRGFMPERPTGHELYDLVRDPAEKVNLLAAPAAPNAVEAGTRFDHALRLALSVRGMSETVTLPASTIEELKALGYVQ